MDLFTYHTLMMGHTKLGRYQRVLVLYDEATQSNAKVSIYCLNLIHCYNRLAYILLFQLDGGVYSLAMLAALSCGLPAQVPRIADKAREQKIQLTMASYTILIQVC